MLTGKESAKYSRKPEIVADAAYCILSQDPKTTTGNFFIDEDVLRKAGVTDFDQYACDPTYKGQLMLDFYVEDAELPKGVPTLGGKVRLDVECVRLT